MSVGSCRSYRRLLTDVPLPFAHRLVQLLERHRDGVLELQADQQLALVVRKAKLSSRMIDRIIEAYRSQPVYVQRAIAGSAYESPLGDSTLDEYLSASYAENILARESRLAVANVLEHQRIEFGETHALVADASAGNGQAADDAPLDPPKKTPPGVGVKVKGGTLVLDGVGDDVVIQPPDETPDDPAKLVAWIVEMGTCNEPVFGTDFVLGVGRFRDGRGREGIRMVRRASGLGFRFDEGQTVSINKSVYGPADPNGFLEIDVDFVEIDSPEDILDALQELSKAAGDLGVLLQNPVVSMAAHLSGAILIFIEAVVDKDGTDLGNISPPIYLSQQKIDAETGKEETRKLSRKVRVGYNWDYDFQYKLSKVGP